MAQFRKSKKFGPVRITASKSGLSASTGVKGARVSANTKGQVRRTVSIPGTGIYDTKRIGSTTPRRSSARSGPAPAVRADTAMSVDYVDGTGGTRQLLENDPTVESLKVIGIPGGTKSIVELAAWAGVRPNEKGWARGIRDGLVLDRGEQLDIVLLVTLDDNPAAFTKKEQKRGSAPKARPIGRLGKRDVAKWRTYSTGGQTVRVGIYLDATPGLDPLMQVRLRPDLLTDEGSASDQSEIPGPTDTSNTPPVSPAGWHPDPYGRHEHRYWDGSTWTSHVASDGVQSIDSV